MLDESVLVGQSCLTPCDPTDYSLLGSSVYGTLQARILEWVAIPFSRGSSWPRDWTWVSCSASRFFTVWATRETTVLFYKWLKIELLLLLLVHWAEVSISHAPLEEITVALGRLYSLVNIQGGYTLSKKLRKISMLSSPHVSTSYTIWTTHSLSLSFRSIKCH